MNYTITDADKRSLRKIKNIGISEIWIYKPTGPYVSNVTVRLVDATFVNFYPQDRHVGGRFEVFVIGSKASRIDAEPNKKLGASRYANIKCVSVISTCEWEVPCTNADKEMLFGNPVGATSVFAGLKINVPNDAIRSQTFDAGIKIEFEAGRPFYIVTGNPFELIISDSLSRVEIDETIYESQIVC